PGGGRGDGGTDRAAGGVPRGAPRRGPLRAVGHAVGAAQGTGGAGRVPGAALDLRTRGRRRHLRPPRVRLPESPWRAPGPRGAAGGGRRLLVPGARAAGGGGRAPRPLPSAVYRAPAEGKGGPGASLGLADDGPRSATRRAGP